MKILILGDINSKHLQRWVYGLEKSGLQILVFSFLPDRAGEIKIQYQSLIKKENRLTPLLQRNLISARGIVAKMIKEFQPDIVHAHYASSYGKLLRSVNFHPSVLSVWGSDVYAFPKQNALFRGILKKNLQSADLVLSTSQAMKLETQLYTQNPIEVLPFGIDTDRFSPGKKEKDTDKIVVGIVKSLLPIYAIDQAIKAIALLDHPKVILKIIGEGPMLSSLNKLCEELQVTNQVLFLGAVPNENIQEEYRQFDLFLNVSHTESFGVSILEASACGIPVIVHDKEGMSEVVVHEKTGLLIPNNTPATIAESIKYLLDNPMLKEKMRSEGPKFVQEEYSLQSCVNRQIEIYQRLV